MRFYRCKCGESEAYGSMPPYRCSKCSKCGSDLAESPESHREPVPHEFEDCPQQDANGDILHYHRCKWCHRTKFQIAREETSTGDKP